MVCLQHLITGEQQNKLVTSHPHGIACCLFLTAAVSEATFFKNCSCSTSFRKLLPLMEKASVPLISTLRTVGGGSKVFLLLLPSTAAKILPKYLLPLLPGRTSQSLRRNRETGDCAVRALVPTSLSNRGCWAFPSFFALPSPGPAVAER